MSIERIDQDPGDVASFGPFRLFAAARRLEREGVPVDIGGRALDILVELVNRAGSVVSKTELMSTIWRDVNVVDGAVRTHVYNLRKSLGDGVGGARYITSVAGRGYCFVAPVVRRAKEAAPGSWKLAHGLPPRLARMAGRDDALRTLVAQLAENRFVTVLGAAGIGKTTVAVAVGHALLDDFGGAVRFIELGSLTDPALVAATVASTLGIRARADEALPSLQAFLHDKRILLVLDNCEHVVDAAARLAEHLFLHAPRVHLLATSREALRVEGERIHRLAPLELSPAIQVFLERAAASGWSGDLTDDDVPVVAEICERLDGVALAIELAASFVGEHGLRGAAAMLDDRLRLLSQHGRRTAPPRQQTLHALIGWSYDRLPERERIVLRRLSVLIGTFPFEAARAIVVDPDAPLLEAMNELAAKSLLAASVEDGAVVYRLLETTRVYALERLVESGELEGVSLRHALFFADRLGHAPASALANVRSALKWSFASPAGHAAGTRLAAAAARMLFDRGLVSECDRWSRLALDVLGAAEVGTRVELDLQEAMAVSAMFTRGNREDVRSALARGIAIARALGDVEREVRLLGQLHVLRIRLGDFGGAMEVAIAAARLAETTADVSAEWMLGTTYHLCGDQPRAQEHCEAALRFEARSGPARTMLLGYDPSVIAHLGLARALWLRGHADRAVTLARQAVAAAATVDEPVFSALILIYGEAVLVWQGAWGEVERLVDMLAEHVERYSLAPHRGVTMALRGELLVKTGRPQEGCVLLRRAAATLESVGQGALATVFAGALAEGLAATGSHGEALATVEAAIVEARRRGGSFDLPELLRLQGEILASDEILLSAIEVARRQGALAWELRAATALARVRGGDLRDLSAVCAKFPEGMPTPDLQAARALLDNA